MALFDTDEIMLDRMEVASQLVISDAVAIRMASLSTTRDVALRAMVANLRAYVAQRRQWEERATVPRKLTWRERIRALFGGEIETELRVTAYRNCPHIQMADQRQHVLFLAPSTRDR